MRLSHRPYEEQCEPHISKNLHDIEMPQGAGSESQTESESPAPVAAALWTAHLNARPHYGQVSWLVWPAAMALDTDFLSLIKLKHVSYRVRRYKALLPGPGLDRASFN